MNKYTIFRTNKFKKDYKKMMKRNNFDEKEFIKVVSIKAHYKKCTFIFYLLI